MDTLFSFSKSYTSLHLNLLIKSNPSMITSTLLLCLNEITLRTFSISCHVQYKILTFYKESNNFSYHTNHLSIF